MARFFAYDEMIPTVDSVSYARDKISQFGKEESLDSRVIIYGSTIWENYPQFGIQHNISSDVDVVFNDLKLGNQTRGIRKKFETYCKSIEKETGVSIEASLFSELQKTGQLQNPFFNDTFKLAFGISGDQKYEDMTTATKGYNNKHEDYLRKNAFLGYLSMIRKCISRIQKEGFDPKNKDHLKTISAISKLPEKYAIKALTLDGRIPTPDTGRNALEIFLKDTPKQESLLLHSFESLNKENAKYIIIIESGKDKMSEEEYNKELTEISKSIRLRAKFVLEDIANSNLIETRLGKPTWIDYQGRFWDIVSSKGFF